MGVLPLTFLSLAAATSPQTTIRASVTAEVALSDRVEKVAVSGQRLYALLPTSLVVLDANGNIVRRLVLPRLPPDSSLDFRPNAKEIAARTVFDKADYPEYLRQTLEGERWLQDESSAKDRPSQQLHAPLNELRDPVDWTMASNQQHVFLASGLGLWSLDTSNEASGLIKVANLRKPPLRMAASAKGKVLISDTEGDSVIDTTADVPVNQTCDALGSQSVELAVFDAEEVDLKAGGCGTVVRYYRKGANVWTSQAGGGARPVELHATALAGCGTFGLINADEGLFMLSKGTTSKLGTKAPFPLLRCNAADPDTLISFAPTGQGAELSRDLGKTWTPISGLVAQPTLDLGVLEKVVWAATEFGLLRLPTTDTGSAPRQWHLTSGGSPLKAPSWIGLLPVVHLTGTVNEVIDGALQQRRRVNGMIAAEFPLGAAAASVYKVSEESYRPQVVSPIATEKPPVCLGELRAAAAHLAMVDPERVHALVARARAAAWLPELRVRAEKRWGRNQSVDLNNDTTLAPLGLDTVNDFRLEVRASWDLARLVYSPDELAISTAGVRAANAGQDLALLINRLFFSRRQHRKALEMSQGPGTNQVPTSGDKGDADGQEPTTSPSRERLAQITADLDALTGGLGNNCW